MIITFFVFILFLLVPNGMAEAYKTIIDIRHERASDGLLKSKFSCQYLDISVFLSTFAAPYGNIIH